MMNKKKSRNKPSKNKTDSSPIISVDGKPYEVPVEGSLGLLALGAVGLMAWRTKREEVEKHRKKTEK